MKNLLKIIVLTIMILTIVMSVPSFGEMKKLAQVGFKGLIMPIGAREVGMGNAVVSVPTGPNSIFWNPAGITEISSKISFTFNYMNWIADVNYGAGAVVFGMENFGMIGVSFSVLDYGIFKGTRLMGLTTDSWMETGDFSPGEIAVGLAYANKVTDKFSFGGHIKYARQDLGAGLEGDDRAQPLAIPFNLSIWAFDFGTLYYTGIRDLRIAMSFQNFSKELKYQIESFPLPLMFRVGVAMNVLTIFWEESPNALTVALDFQHPRDFSERMNMGAEYLYQNPTLKDLGINSLALRGGYKLGYDEESWAFGFGINAYGARIDYAIQEFGIFDNVSSFSLGLDVNF
jgi:hypothetical protein